MNSILHTCKFTLFLVWHAMVGVTEGEYDHEKVDDHQRCWFFKKLFHYLLPHIAFNTVSRDTFNNLMMTSM